MRLFTEREAARNRARAERVVLERRIREGKDFVVADNNLYRLEQMSIPTDPFGRACHEAALAMVRFTRAFFAPLPGQGMSDGGDGDAAD